MMRGRGVERCESGYEQPVGRDERAAGYPALQRRKAEMAQPDAEQRSRQSSSSGVRGLTERAIPRPLHGGRPAAQGRLALGHAGQPVQGARWGAERQPGRGRGPAFPCLAEEVFREGDFSGKHRLVGGAAVNLMAAAAMKSAGLALGFGWTLVALALAHAEPVSAHIVGLGAVWSHPRLLGFRLPGAGRFGLALLRPLRRPMLALGAARVALPLAAPSLWRSLRYWRRIVPIFCRYLWAKHRAVRLRRQGRDEEAELVWERRHAAGAEEIFQMLVDLRGFYLKLEQILATKTDMLGPVYTRSLGRLHDQMPFESVQHVRRMLAKHLKRPSEDVFQWIDALPLASATIAQVHRATLADGEPVVVKIQHRGVERMMRSDLRNMRLFSELLELSPLDLGFDMLSLIREYQAIVPFEFDFVREGTMQALVKKHLAETGYGPFLVVPRVLSRLTTKHVLVMEHLDGVPILDVELMQELDKVEFMTKLIRSFGVMILRDGVFHTDPHPGNLLALHNHQTGQTAVGLLDFGQVKELTAEAQENYAKLVLAMADRNPVKVRSVMKAIGLDIRGCSEEFQALAGYILFDTRMDFDEAWMSPFDEAAHEFRKTIVKVFPQELFMIMRVITLFRGILGSLEVDVSSSLLWRDLAEDVLMGKCGLRAQSESGTAASPLSAPSSGGLTPKRPTLANGIAPEMHTPVSDPDDTSFSINLSAVRELEQLHAQRQLDFGGSPSPRGAVGGGEEARSSLDNMKELLAASKRPGGAGPILNSTIQDMMRQVPKLRSINTAPAGVEDVASGGESPREEGALNLRLRPFETLASGAEMSGGAAPAEREALKTHDGWGFTFSPHASDRAINSTQTWGGLPTAQDDLAVARRPLGDPAQHGASGSSSARFAPAPPASGGPPAGGTVMEKAMHMRAGAPQMNYKVKLSDV
eukprot:jgi/Tetstr1/456801/TSEL_043475.t1